ncbi:MAG: DUF1801 domain-containing protein [Pseudomonadota bacterium]
MSDTRKQTAEASDPPFADAAVAAAFAAFPDASRAGLLALRRLILDTAAKTPGVGSIHETLKWGQPSYLTHETGSGTTIRLGIPKEGGIAVFTHCQTTVIADFRALFPDTFRYDGNRAVMLPDPSAPPPDAIGMLIRSALTYHMNRKRPVA